jgi:hypothetical protein
VLTKIRYLSTHHLDFLTYHTSPHKEELGRVLYDSRMNIFMGGTSKPPEEGEQSIYTCPKKLAIGS